MPPLNCSLHEIDCTPNHIGIHNTVLNSFLGLDILVDAWRQNPSSALHAALFMNALRLYIHVALVSKRPLPQSIPSCCLTSSICPSPDDPRAINARVTILVARTLDYCYDEQPKTLQRWQGLCDELDNWKVNLPASFQPMLETDASVDPPFGNIMFANDVHGTSKRLYKLSQRSTNTNHSSISPILLPGKTTPHQPRSAPGGASDATTNKPAR